MNYSRAARFLADATSGRLSRRQVLETGLTLGIATPILTSLWQAAPASAASHPASDVSLVPALQDGGSGALSLLITIGT
ncbi:MAG: hypothetical protein ACR2J8_16140, partial [Thermomicrobiales bacterium]